MGTGGGKTREKPLVKAKGQDLGKSSPWKKTGKVETEEKAATNCQVPN